MQMSVFASLYFIVECINETAGAREVDVSALFARYLSATAAAIKINQFTARGRGNNPLLFSPNALFMRRSVMLTHSRATSVLLQGGKNISDAYRAGFPDIRTTPSLRIHLVNKEKKVSFLDAFDREYAWARGPKQLHFLVERIRDVPNSPAIYRFLHLYTPPFFFLFCTESRMDDITLAKSENTFFRESMSCSSFVRYMNNFNINCYGCQ